MTNAALQYAPTIPGQIHRAGFGWINVGGQIYEQDRVIDPGGVSGVWWRERRHHFNWDDAQQLIGDDAPRLLILGTGWMGMMRFDLQYLQARFSEVGVQFFAERTPQAIALYQQYFSRGQPATVALHLTC